MKKEVLGIKAPDVKGVQDKKCPFYGDLAVKKETLSGIVVKKDVNRSATIEWNKSVYIPKFERYEVRRYRLRVHNPASINAEIGQKVLVARTRPLSKTKNHVIIKILAEAVAKPIVEEELIVRHKQNKKKTDEEN
jgi:small subunit ribosomal protein S17